MSARRVLRLAPEPRKLTALRIQSRPRLIGSSGSHVTSLRVSRGLNYARPMEPGQHSIGKMQLPPSPRSFSPPVLGPSRRGRVGAKATGRAGARRPGSAT